MILKSNSFCVDQIILCLLFFSFLWITTMDVFFMVFHKIFKWLCYILTSKFIEKIKYIICEIFFYTDTIYSYFVPTLFPRKTFMSEKYT